MALMLADFSENVHRGVNASDRNAGVRPESGLLGSCLKINKAAISRMIAHVLGRCKVLAAQRLSSTRRWNEWLARHAFGNPRVAGGPAIAHLGVELRWLNDRLIKSQQHRARGEEGPTDGKDLHLINLRGSERCSS
jgi:hypothetical protein